MTKAEIRTLMKEKRNCLTREEQLEQSQAIRLRLFRMEEYQRCEKLFTFLSMQSEADTWGIVEKAFSDGKQVFAPRVDRKTMNFYRIKEIHSLSPSKFGVLEPNDSDQLPYGGADRNTSVNLMLLPGLAFDPYGNRIGYGAGYYDRYLTEHGSNNFIKAALAYDFQILDKIDAEPFDVRTDMIITPERLIECR